MGVFSRHKSSTGPSGLDSVGVATLGGIQVSLTLLEKLMDGASIPFVKGAVGTALEVIKIARGIQSDREDCDNLIKRTTALLIVILDSLKGKTEKEIPSCLKQAIETLSMSFQEVFDELKIIEKRAGKRSASSLVRALLYHYDNIEKLKECSAKLEWAIAEFQVTSKVDSCLKDLERHKELREELLENRTITQKGHANIEAKIEGGQAELEAKIEDGQAKIEAKIQDGQAKIQQDLAKIREDVIDKITGTAPLSLPSTVMPANPKIFGRQSYMEKVVQLLLSATSTRVAILGPGGMGKTSVALMAIHDARVMERFGVNRRWIPCEQATSIPLFIELIAKSLGLPPSTSNDRFSEVVAALEQLGVLLILLFDNFETIWDLEGEQPTVAIILSRLASIPSVSLLLTMRGIQHPASNLIDWTSPRLTPLTPLEMDPAQQAFVQISPNSEGDPSLPELLRELDCMPLAITLMAKLAEVGETITELLSQWRQEQVKLLSQPGGDRTNSIEVSIRLSLMSSSVRANSDAISLLSVLAKLPGGASLEQLPTICPSIPDWKRALRVLRIAALVYDSPERTAVYMLSPIRSYVSLHHPLADGPLQDLRNAYYQLAGTGLANLGDSNFVDVVVELSKEDINLDTIILDALHSADDKEDAIHAALGYAQYLNFVQPRVNVIEAAIHAARNTGSARLAFCLECYGDTLRYQSQYDVATLALEEARERHIRLGNHSNASSCLWTLGEILRMQNRLDEACSKLEEARLQYIELNRVGGAADCLCGLGQIYKSQGDFEMAISTLELAGSQYVEIGSELGSVNCLQLLGSIYWLQGQYVAAFSAASETKSRYIKLGVPLGLAHSLKLMSNIHEDQGHYSEAFSLAEEARITYSRLGNKFGATASLMRMASILVKQEELDKARRCTEEAKNDYIRMGDILGIGDSHRFLADILRMQGEHDVACSVLEEAKSLFVQHNNNHNSSGSVGIVEYNTSLGKVSRLRGQQIMPSICWRGQNYVFHPRLQELEGSR
ncbi:hypothetical protein FRC03_002866 [Tulasnella sp. 419]|nr:hypothetical protein FRC03_002866 [Tulasnella sp. 419]